MTTIQKRILVWAPRVLTLAFACFISLFALDAFRHGHGFWENLRDFAMHLIPTGILLLILALAWRWPWIGALGAAALLGLFLYWNFTVRHNVLSAVLIISAPLALLIVLYLWNWWKRAELSTREPS